MDAKTIQVEGTVFPSTENTINVIENKKYGSAYAYSIQPMSRLDSDNHTVYSTEHPVFIRFVQRLENGKWLEGVQDEQLAYILLDRVKKLDAKFSSPWNKLKIKALEIYLSACKYRIKERIANNKFGKLIK
jgi:hypothetical protein